MLATNELQYAAEGEPFLDRVPSKYPTYRAPKMRTQANTAIQSKSSIQAHCNAPVPKGDHAARELSLATLKGIFTCGSDGLLVRYIILVPLATSLKRSTQQPL